MASQYDVIKAQYDKYAARAEEIRKELDELTIRMDESQKILQILAVDKTARSLKPRKQTRSTRYNTSHKQTRHSRVIDALTIPNTGVTVTKNVVDSAKTNDLHVDTHKPANRPTSGAYLLCVTNNTVWNSFRHLSEAMGASTNTVYNHVTYDNGRIIFKDYEFKWFVPRTDIPVQEDGEYYSTINDYAMAKGESLKRVIRAIMLGNEGLDIQFA